MAFACIPVHLREGKLPIKTHCNLVINGRLEPSRAFRGDGSGFTSDTRSLHVPQLTENLKNQRKTPPAVLYDHVQVRLLGRQKWSWTKCVICFFFRSKDWVRHRRRRWVHEISQARMEQGVYHGSFHELHLGRARFHGYLRRTMELFDGTDQISHAACRQVVFLKRLILLQLLSLPPHDLFPPKCANPIEVNRRSCFMLQCLIWSDSAL